MITQLQKNIRLGFASQNHATMPADTALAVLTNWLGSLTMILIVAYHVRAPSNQIVVVSAQRQADASADRAVQN